MIKKPDHCSHLFPVEHNQTVCTECPVRRLALFRGVSEQDLAWTQSYRSSQYKVAPRKEIYREGRNSDFMFTLYHGWVALYKTLGNGKRQILRVSLPGDILGFQSNLDAPMTHSAVALTEAVLCAFPRKDVPELLRTNPSVAKRLTELNARDMNICQTRLVTIGQQSAIERIAFFCTELLHRVRSIYRQPDSQEIFFPLSQEDIGDATGLTKIHVNRTLKALREQGLMEISSRTLKIHDLPALEELGGFEPSLIQTYSLY